MRIVGALLLIAGCDRAFGLGDPKTPDAAPPPPMLACGMVPQPACRSVTLTSEADTYLSSTEPDRVFSDQDVLFAGPSNPVLLKFDTTDQIHPGDCLSELKLTLTTPPTSRLCSTIVDTCSPCKNTYDAVQLHWMTTDWSQNSASYRNHDAGVEWSVPGAGEVPAERSATVSTATNDGSPSVIDATTTQIAMTPPDNYVATSRLALLVVTQIGIGVFGSHRPNDCGPVAGPTVDLTLCATP